MKARLVIGLGNPLMGDEGVGWHVIERLRSDPRLPGDTDLLWGGTDLLACAAQMEGRRQVVLVDALLDATVPVGSVTVWNNSEEIQALEERQAHAHHLSVVQALQLLPLATPALRSVPIRLIAVGVSLMRLKPELSSELAAKLPRLLDRVLQELAAT